MNLVKELKHFKNKIRLMRFLAIVVSAVLLMANSDLYSQNSEINSGNNGKINELKEKVLNQDNHSDKISINANTAGSSKSPALAVLFSLIVPGAGHLYINRMDVGKYFFGADLLSWLGLAALNVYGDDVSNQSKVYSVQHAEIGSTNGKDDNFFANIGSYKNVYLYNDAMLTQGAYGSLYDVNTYFWDWDNLNNQNIYEEQRKSSERIYNSRIIFGSFLIINRVVSGISAYLLSTSNKSKSAAVNIIPELLYKNDYSFDGVKLNISKNF